MSEQRVGSRWSVALYTVAVLGMTASGLSGCEASGGEPAEAERSSQAAPERVVQHMAPGPNMASTAKSSGSVPGGVAAQNMTGPSTASNASGARAVERISPKSLEAELNRLEAELAN